METDAMLADFTAEKQDTTDSAHLVQLPGGAWQLWRVIGLRVAGFPIEQVLELAATASSAMADKVLAAEKEEQHALHQAIGTIDNELDRLRLNQEWSMLEKRYPLLNTIKALRKGKVLNQDITYASDAARDVETYKKSCIQRFSLHQEFQQTFAEEMPQLLANLHKIIQAERFQEAIIWQNRQAYQTGIRKLINKVNIYAPTKKQRERANLATNYLHRYCAKNDTIGFFGPVGWAYFQPEETSITVQPGSTMLANREVFFEQWGIEALAEKINQNQLLRSWIPPRPHPYIYLDGNVLHQAYRKSTTISEKQAAVLKACFAACDGVRTAKEVVRYLGQSLIFSQKSEAALYAFLEFLHKSGLILWEFQLPFNLHPQRELRQFLEYIDDEQKLTFLNDLEMLEMARKNVAQAANNIRALEPAIAQLENVFTTITGKKATRLAGKMYAGRTLIYEDCRRDITVNIGSEILEALGQPLSLLLTSARWYTYEASTRYRQAFADIYQSLVQQTGQSQVSLANFWQHTQSILVGNHIPLIESITRDFQERWAEVFAIPSGHNRVYYSSEALQSKVAAAFAAPRPGWLLARYHSPDVMIMAKDVEAIQRGQYELVMGELHMGMNSLGAACFMGQHITPETLLQAVQEDIPSPRIVPLNPTDWPDITSRTRPAFVLERDLQLAFTPDFGGLPQSHILPIGSLVVTHNGNTLVIQTRDGQKQFDIIEVVADAIMLQIVSQFKILQPLNYTPRITIDRLVVSRETWRLSGEKAVFAWEDDESERFLASRRWAQMQGLPRFVFVKSPIERKPIYVDFENVYSINTFAKTIRQTVETTDLETTSISITEMLPAPSQVWLPDANGYCYTSELRIVAVDSIRYQANTLQGDTQ